MPITNRVADPLFLAGVAVAVGARIEASPAPLTNELKDLISRRAGETFPPPEIKEGLRALLKRGGFKPTGRNKPASEYLAQAAREGRFPFINNLVDINNLLSLEIGLPISLLDFRVTGEDAVLRYGAAEEKYVFNNAGQEIDLEGLICLCGGEGQRPLGNPVKDSMEAKLKPDTKDVIGVIYGTKELVSPEQMKRYVERFSELLRLYGGALKTDQLVL